jgi:peptide/nickel transport system ATP-binding protein/oligopeptide transport system ATP-binding protein
MQAPLLTVENLRTEFRTHAGTVRAVDGVDLTIEAGKTLCVVGESGSGKSVTALSIMRLIDPPGRIVSGSRILYGDRNLAELRDAELRAIRGNDIAMIFQEPMSSLNPVHRIGDQIAGVVRLHRGVSKREARERAVEMLSLVGIPAPERRMSDYPHQLSGGMRQRVMIAAALSCEPRLLIADEPTTALDVTIQAQILELLKDLRERLGMAVLLITHDLGVVSEIADDVAVMYAGRVVERGAARDVLDSPQHPYTEALLHSVPLIGMTHAQRLKVIRGVVPSALNWPQGCRFAPRCDQAFARCTKEDPPLLAAGEQDAACWLCVNGRRPSRGIRDLTASA